jgi:hypothetical protein
MMDSMNSPMYALFTWNFEFKAFSQMFCCPYTTTYVLYAKLSILDGDLDIVHATFLVHNWKNQNTSVYSWYIETHRRYIAFMIHWRQLNGVFFGNLVIGNSRTKCWHNLQVYFISHLTYYQGCSLGLDVSVSRRSRDLIFKRLSLVSISDIFGEVSSRSRLGQKAKRLCLVSVSEPIRSHLQVTFSSFIFPISGSAI